MITDKENFLKFIEKNNLHLDGLMKATPFAWAGFKWVDMKGELLAFQRVLPATFSSDIAEYHVYPEDIT